MILYRTGGYGKIIEEVEVTRANDKSFWAYSDLRKKEERSARHTSYTQHWDTLDEAKSYLKEKLLGKIEYAESSVLEYKNQLKELNEY